MFDQAVSVMVIVVASPLTGDQLLYAMGAAGVFVLLWSLKEPWRILGRLAERIDELEVWKFFKAKFRSRPEDEDRDQDDSPLT